MTPRLLPCCFISITVLLCLMGCTRYVPPSADTYVNPLARYRYSCQSIDSLVVAEALPELEIHFGKKLRADASAAASIFSELRGLQIKLIRRRPPPMAARPGSRPPPQPSHAIYVDDVTVKAADFRKASYSAQVGCFIHELGHISHYVTRSNAQLAGEGMAYITNQQYKNRYERIADRFAIRNGGGYYVYQYRTFTFEETDLPEAYLAFKKRNYTGQKILLARHLEYLRENSVEKCIDY